MKYIVKQGEMRELERQRRLKDIQPTQGYQIYLYDEDGNYLQSTTRATVILDWVNAGATPLNEEYSLIQKRNHVIYPCYMEWVRDPRFVVYFTAKTRGTVVADAPTGVYQIGFKSSNWCPAECANSWGPVTPAFKKTTTRGDYDIQ